MRVFLLAQQRGLALHPDLTALIRAQLALVDRAFLADEQRLHGAETLVVDGPVGHGGLGSRGGLGVDDHGRGQQHHGERVSHWFLRDRQPQPTE